MTENRETLALRRELTWWKDRYAKMVVKANELKCELDLLKARQRAEAEQAVAEAGRTEQFVQSDFDAVCTAYSPDPE